VPAGDDGEVVDDVPVRGVVDDPVEAVWLSPGDAGLEDRVADGLGDGLADGLGDGVLVGMGVFFEFAVPVPGVPGADVVAGRTARYRLRIPRKITTSSRVDLRKGPIIRLPHWEGRCPGTSRA
jgi:hypothetical protein